MTYEQVAAMISEIGIPYAYHQFPNGTALECPFACFYFEDDDDFKADNKNYQLIRPLTIELYTDNKDFALESVIESVLDTHSLAYSRTETYIGSQRMFLVAYTADIVITEE